MSTPVPEEINAAEDLTEAPPGEHTSELPGSDDGDQASASLQEENAATTADQPSS